MGEGGGITETSFNKIKIETNLGESKEVYHNYYYFIVFVSLNEVIFGISEHHPFLCRTFLYYNYFGSITAPLVYY